MQILIPPASDIAELVKDEEQIPEQLAASPAFRNFCADWPTAVPELSEFNKDLKQMKSDISS